MKVSLIVARGRNHVIGHEGRMPWHLPADLAHFKATTLGAPVIMGRKTFAAIGRPLPGRRNIVVSRQPDWHADGVLHAASLTAAFDRAADAPEVFIIGGGEIYRAGLPHADQLIVTEVDATPAGDTRFDFTEDEFVETERHALPADARNAHAAVIRILARRARPPG